MKKVGRKPLLTEEQRKNLMNDYARYQRVQARYERLMQKLAPSVLGRKYNVSTSTVIDYARGRHKGEVNYGRAIREARVPS